MIAQATHEKALGTGTPDKHRDAKIGCVALFFDVRTTVQRHNEKSLTSSVGVGGGGFCSEK